MTSKQEEEKKQREERKKKEAEEKVKQDSLRKAKWAHKAVVSCGSLILLPGILLH